MNYQVHVANNNKNLLYQIANEEKQRKVQLHKQVKRHSIKIIRGEKASSDLYAKFKTKEGIKDAHKIVKSEKEKPRPSKVY